MQRFLATTTGHASSEEQEEAEFGEYVSFGVIPLAMTLGILTRFTLAKWLPLPYTVLLLLWGCVFGAIYTELEDPFNGALDNSIGSWLGMDPRMLQVVFFPILIFASAFNAQFHILERRLGQIIFLALPGVMLGATLTAVFIKLVLPYDWDWELCFVFGSMVAATDPVAVVALLEELGVSEKLGTLIEGESLLNDGSAIVVFEVFIEAIEGTDRNWLEVIGFGARLALGGPAIGAVIGVGGAFFLGYVINDALIEVSLTIILAYSTFALCEATAVKVSGVLGIVACGVMLSYYGKPRVSSPVLPSLMDFWKTLQFFADTVIFFLSGLIVVGVAVNDRSIDGEDFGYLLVLFVALYIIRGIVVLFAYPVLRSGEYKITIPQMIVLTHSGLRGAVALILALVVDGVHVIEIEQRDKIMFLTAGVAVLSLLFNGTTTGPLVRFLKLDRASEASKSVFGKACFALELSMEEQQRVLQQDPFLSDANWSLVWRYIPLFTAESYWHRLSKGHITPSSEEVEDIRNANSSTSLRDQEPFKRFMAWVYDKAGLYYKTLPHRLRSPWFAFHKMFLFDDAGGESVWGPLDEFLANRSTSQDSDVWSGHLKHSVHGGRTFWTTAAEYVGHGHTAAATAAEDTDADSEENMEGGEGMAQGVGEEKTSKAGTGHVAFKVPGDDLKEEEGEGVEAHTTFEDIHPEQAPSQEERATHRSGNTSLFQRATNMMRAAGINVNFKAKDEAEGELDKSALLEARLRFLCALKAEYFKAKREGKLGSSGLRVLTEAMNYAHDRVDKGCVLDGWSDISGHFSPGWETIAATYMNWWPARPLVAAAIARHVSFQMELAWNFLEAHHESNVKSILEDNGEISKVQAKVNLENQEQINHAEDTIARLTVSAPMVTRGVKTRTAARVMIKRFREAVEHLAENGLLDEKEEEVLITAATVGELRIAYHPNLEKLPPLPMVLEKIEFLAELTAEERKKLIESGAAAYQEYVGEVRLIEMGKKSGEGDLCCWFYVVRGQVEKTRMVEAGEIELGTHSSGMLFGITDTMLEIPHHAGYTTHGFSNLVVFDRAKLVKLAETMPSLDESLWKTVAAHCLRRTIRFHEFALKSCHTVLDKATFLSGQSGPEEEEVITMQANDVIVLVRGKIISLEGEVTVVALGQADTSMAPVLLEPLGGEGGSLKVSGDYKILKTVCRFVRMMSSYLLQSWGCRDRRSGDINAQPTYLQAVKNIIENNSDTLPASCPQKYIVSRVAKTLRLVLERVSMRCEMSDDDCRTQLLLVFYHYAINPHAKENASCFDFISKSDQHLKQLLNTNTYLICAIFSLVVRQQHKFMMSQNIIDVLERVYTIQFLSSVCEKSPHLLEQLISEKIESVIQSWKQRCMNESEDRALSLNRLNQEIYMLCMLCAKSDPSRLVDAASEQLESGILNKLIEVSNYLKQELAPQTDAQFQNTYLFVDELEKAVISLEQALKDSKKEKEKMTLVEELKNEPPHAEISVSNGNFSEESGPSDAMEIEKTVSTVDGDVEMAADGVHGGDMPELKEVERPAGSERDGEKPVVDLTKTDTQ